jgi:hypothetical protein
MAGFRQGGLSLKHRDNGAASDINYVSFYVDSLDRLYSVDEFGTSALVSNQWSTGCIDSDIQSLIRTTDNITIPTQNVAIFSNANFRGPLYRKTITSASFSIPRDGQSKYVVVDYDNGTPYYRIETDRSVVNQSNVVCLYIVWNVSGSIHAIEFDNKGEGLANKIDNSILLTTPYRRSIDGGLIISVDASRYIQVTPAVVFAGTTPISILSFTSQTDRVTEISHSSGNWSFTETMAGYQVDNLYYDNGTDKVAANNNKYICRWVYRTIGDDKEVFVRLGTSEYNNLSDAQKESEPNNPGIAKEHAMLIGRIIIQKAATTCVYESIFTIFGASQGTSVSNHNDLNNIQGGDQVGSNYYHLDLLRYSYTSAISADVQTQLNNLQMLTSGTGITQVYADAHYLKLDGTNGPITSNLGVTGTISAASVSAIDISGTTLNVGNISNTEFGRLDGVSANIQTQLSNLSGTNSLKVDKTTQVIAGAGLVGGGSLSANVTLSLSALNTAGTYPKVTTDNYGRVLSGTTLVASDIPTGIDASKISTGIISNTEFGYLDGVSANIQTQLSNLSGTNSSKANSSIVISGTSGLIGGGDLTQNRNIGLPNVGAVGTYTKVTTDQYGRVSAGTSLTSGDIPTLPPSKILEDANDRFVTDIQIGKWDSVYNSVSGTSANWNSVFSSVSATSASWNAASVSAHNHGNKAILDQINQSVATSASVSFVSISATNISGSSLTIGNISNTEFSYLDGATSNIQTQINGIRNWVLSGDSYYVGSNENTGNQWLKLASGTLGDSYTYHNGIVSINGGYNGRLAAKVVWYIHGNTGLALSAMSPNPRIEVIASNGLDPVNFKLIITSDYPSTKSYELWYNCPSSFTALSFSFLNVRVGSGVFLPNSSSVWTSASSSGTTYSGSYTIFASSAKFGNLSTSAVVVTDGNKNLVSSPITTTELNYLDGVTSNIQSQFDNITSANSNFVKIFTTSSSLPVGPFFTNQIPSASHTSLVFTNYGSSNLDFIRYNDTDNSYTFFADSALDATTPTGAISTYQLSATSTIVSNTNINAPVFNESGTALSARYAPYNVFSTVQANSADWELNNNDFRQSISAGYSRLVTFSNTSTGSTEGILLDIIGYVVGDNRRGNFNIYFGAHQIQAMTCAAPAPILYVEENENSGWSFGYTIDTDTSASKTYTLWAYHASNYAYLRGSCQTKHSSTVMYFRDTPQTGIPAGYTAASYANKKLNSIDVDQNIQVGTVTNTAEYDLLTFKTEREWAFRKIGTGSTTYLALNDASGGKWFNIGMLNNPTVEIGTHSSPGSRLFKATGQIYFNSLSGVGDQVSYLDTNGRLIRSSTTLTELGYLSGTSANIQSQINNILNGTTGKFTSAINISVGNQTIVVNHNLGYLRPTVKIYHEATNTEIFVCPIFTSTSQLSLPILSSSVFSSARLEVYV